MKILLFLALVTIIPQLAAQNTSSTAFANEKKLIEYGWDSPNIGFVKKSISEMEKKPFDGIIFKLNNNTVSWVFGLAPIDEKLLEQDLADAEGIEWNKFTDNFIILYCASEQDWFNDEHWKLIAEKARIAARVAKKAGCVGICFDPEPYGVSPWQYAISAHAKTRTFSEYEAKVRERGAQFIRALESEFPGLTLLSFFQLTYFNGLLTPMAPEARLALLQQHQYAFLPAFLNGMLDASTTKVQFVDGNEASYYYAAANQYMNVYHEIIQRCKILIAPENQLKYRMQMQVGQALYLDEYMGMRKNAIGEFIDQASRQKWLEHNTFWGLYSADRYVWCYSEQMNWWQNKIPEGCEAALDKARRLIREGSLIGFTIDDIIARGYAKKAEITLKDSQISLAKVHKIPANVKAPAIDGIIDDAVWTGMKDTGVLSRMKGDKRPLDVTTTFKMTYDNNNLYFAISCPEPLMNKLKLVSSNARDSDYIWDQGDAIEIMLSTQTDAILPFAHIAISPSGATWDALHKNRDNPRVDIDLGFNPEYLCKTSKDSDAWFVEISLPWKELGLETPKPGTAIRGNLCRQRQPIFEYTTWSVQTNGFLEHTLYGIFEFTE